MWSGLRASRAKRWMKRACLQKLLGFHDVWSGLPTAFPLFSPNWPVLAFMDTSRYLTAGKHTLNHEARTEGWQNGTDLTSHKIALYREQPLSRRYIRCPLLYKHGPLYRSHCTLVIRGTGKLRISGSWMLPNLDQKEYEFYLTCASILVLRYGR